MGEVAKQWMVELGWAVDTAGMSKAEQAIKQAEDRVTAENARALARRAAQENAARQERIAADLAAGRKLSEEDAQFVAAMEKRRRTASEESHKHEVESFKKSNVLRDEQFKLASQNFLRLNGVAQAFTTGLSGAIGALPFGGMILGVQRTASSLSNLAVQAQRVGSSAAHIQRFVHGMRYAGVDEGQANGALEGFAAKIKTNEPGFREALKGIGIRTTDANGKPLDIEQLAESFGNDFLAKQDYTTAHKWSQDYGIGDDALNAFRNGQFRRGAGDYDERAKTFGFDADKASEDARKVSKAWLGVETDFKLINTRLQAEFFTPFLESLDAVARKLEENPKQVENIGRAMEALGVLVAARTLPPLANLLIKLTGLSAILGGSVGSLLGIIANPVVALGASAESTPGAGIPADPAERAKVAEENRRLTEEANRKQGSTGSFWQDSWNYIKGKVGLGDDQKVKTDISTTAEATKKLADRADGFGGGLGGGPGSSGNGASLGDRLAHGKHGLGAGGWKGNYGQKGWWTDERQSHAVDYLMKNAGLTEDGAKALVSRWRYVESPGGPTAVNPISGAEGIAQWLGSRKGGGSSGSFDEQLAKVAKELNDGSDGSRGKAKRLLNTPGREAAGASTFERAEGYNSATGEDNFTARTREGMKHIPHNAPVAPTAAAPSPAGTSEKAITDQEVFAARQRIINGSRDPKDRALVKEYLRQQNTPKGRTLGDLSGMLDMHRAVASHMAGQAHDAQRYAYSSTSNVRHGDFTRAGDTFNIKANDTKGALDAVQKLSARRDYEDRARYAQRSQA